MVNIKLAGILVQMNNQFSDLEILCQEYLTEEQPKLFLSVSRKELETERSMQDDIFSDGYLETVCMYRKLALEALAYQVFVFHASVIEVDGEGYAFLAPSGTGKTTQTRLWLEHFGNRARVINGDKPLIRMVKKEDSVEFHAYGTPWRGKEGMGCNACVPLKAFFFVERALQPECIPASQEKSVDSIFRQLLLPEDINQMEQLLEMVDCLVETVPGYILRCNMKEESVKAAYDAVKR